MAGWLRVGCGHVFVKSRFLFPSRVEEFNTINVRTSFRRLDNRRPYIDETSVIIEIEDEPKFHLVSEYLRAFRTLEGVQRDLS